MGNLWDYDGAIFKNELQHVLQIVPYRADGLRAETNSPDIPPGKTRLVNNDHIGDADFYLVLAFMRDAVVPDRVGITQYQTSGGGSFGIGVEGLFGIELGGEGGNTYSLSSSMAAGIVALKRSAARKRFESEASYRVVSKAVSAYMASGRQITVNGEKPTNTNVEVWEFEIIGPRNKVAEKNHGLSSLGW